MGPKLPLPGMFMVYDRKVSHKDHCEVSKFLIYLAKIYGPKLTVTSGKIHNYLGMDLDYTPGEY